MQVRGLIDAGLPTRIIRQILPCLNKPRVIHFTDATPEMIAMLERERVECLARNRDAIAEYLDEIRSSYDTSPANEESGPQPH